MCCFGVRISHANSHAFWNGPASRCVQECPSEPVHFCESNFFMPVDKEEGSDTPRSFCATPEEHGMPVWKDRNADASGYEENEPSHCVCLLLFAQEAFFWLLSIHNVSYLVLQPCMLHAPIVGPYIQIQKHN